jgi:transposase
MLEVYLARQVPWQNSTGGKTRLGGMSKRGNQYLRQLLINGAIANLLRSKATNFRFRHHTRI